MSPPELSPQSLWLDRPDTIAVCRSTIDALGKETLSERESLAFITDIAAAMSA